MTKANECTCPSGDGSLRHPCPAHPAVEQAGGDERDLQGAQGERDGWGPFPIVQVPWNVFDRAVMWVEDRRRYGDDGTIVDDWKALKTIQRAALAQPSPAQAEAERPEVVARVVHSNPVVLGQCGPLNANDELMTVAQHAASVARWAEMFNRVEQQRDALEAEAQALREEVAALRARVVVVPERKLLNAGVPGLNRNSGWNACLDELARLNGKTVSEWLLRQLLDSDGIDGIFDAQQNYAAHQELRALLNQDKESSNG